MANALGAVAAVFGFGAAVICCASLLPFGRKAAGELWPLYRSEFFIVGFLLLPAAGGRWTFLLLLLAMGLRAQFELFDLFGEAKIAAVQAAGMVAGAVLIAVATAAPAWFAPGLAFAVPAVLLLGFLLECSLAAPRAWLAAASLLCPVLLVALTGFLRSRPNGFAWIFLIYATVETNDAFALVAGKLIGRRHVLPRLSPRKTLEGFLAGLAVGAATGYAIARYLMGFSLAHAMLAVAAILAAGLAGDFLSSALKRRCGRKDFRPVAVLHGGILDIYDSLLFAAPVVLLLQFCAGL